MFLGSFNLVVNDPDEALQTYLKLFGTNNVGDVIKFTGLNDGTEILDGYYLKTQPVNLGIYHSRSSTGRMGSFLEKYGEGIHHIDLQLGQDEFELTYDRFKQEGMAVSEKLVYLGKFSEALFWLDGSGDQAVPIRFVTKAYRGLTHWENTEYMDTPRRAQVLELTDEYIMPKVTLGTIMVTVKDWDKQRKVWTNILSTEPLNVGNLSTLQEAAVDDKRGNIFVPVKYRLPKYAAINLYCALNQDAPINKVMDSRSIKVMYHNICSYVTRDRVHDYWKLLEKAGFCMVDPRPMLNADSGNGNYFYFVHPVSTHGVLMEIVSRYQMDDQNRLHYDWNETRLNMVPPDIND